MPGFPLLAILVALNASAAELRCPPELRAGLAGDKSWFLTDMAAGPRSYPLEYVVFFDGPVADNVRLAPTDFRSTNTQYTWEFTEGRREMTVVCGYGNTSFGFVRQLPRGAGSCQVSYRLAKKQGDAKDHYIVDSVQCGKGPLPRPAEESARSDEDTLTETPAPAAARATAAAESPQARAAPEQQPAAAQSAEPATSLERLLTNQERAALGALFSADKDAERRYRDEKGKHADPAAVSRWRATAQEAVRKHMAVLSGGRHSPELPPFETAYLSVRLMQLDGKLKGPFTQSYASVMADAIMEQADGADPGKLQGFLDDIHAVIRLELERFLAPGPEVARGGTPIALWARKALVPGSNLERCTAEAEQVLRESRTPASGR